MMLLLTVAVGDDLEQEPGAVDVDGQVAEFVDDEQVGLADGLEFLVEPVLGFGLAQPHDQAGGGEEPDRYAPPAGEGADGDGEARSCAHARVVRGARGPRLGR